MKAKIVGITVFLVLALSIVVAGVGAVSQALGPSTAGGAGGTVVARYDTANPATESTESSQIYEAFTFVCPFH
jgi:NADH:ubiquinone oxidoreductase subunit 3 (subunit A)